MYTLSFTGYVDGDVEAVRDRVSRRVEVASTLQSAEVTPLARGLSQVVVNAAWDPDDENSRRQSTLAATRLAAEVFEAVVAA